MIAESVQECSLLITPVTYIWPNTMFVNNTLMHLVSTELIYHYIRLKIPIAALHICVSMVYFFVLFFGYLNHKEISNCIIFIPNSSIKSSQNQNHITLAKQTQCNDD